MKIVSCYRRGNQWYCLRDDYTVVALDFFPRGTTVAPKPPSRLCRYPDPLRLVFQAEPEWFVEEVGVPCAFGFPCHAALHRGGRTVYTSFSEEECEECVAGGREDAVCMWPLRALAQTMWYARHVARYSMAVFIGRRKAYPAPWSPTESVYNTMLVLGELGVLPEEFPYQVVSRFNAYTIYDLLFYERKGTLRALGFNLYPNRKNEYTALALIWVSSDRAAYRYAKTVWEMHENVTLRVVEAAKGAGSAAAVLGALRARGFDVWAPGHAEGQMEKMVEYNLVLDPSIGAPVLHADPEALLEAAFRLATRELQD